MSSSESSSECCRHDPTFDNLEFHMGVARWQLQILREGRTGEAKAQMDKLYWALNKGMIKMRIVQRGDQSKQAEKRRVHWDDNDGEEPGFGVVVLPTVANGGYARINFTK
jgi:hypothetical protein